MVADEEEDGDAGAGDGGDALGEFPLVGLGGIAALVGVAGEENEVGGGVEGALDDFVKCAEEVLEAGGEPGSRVYDAVVFHAYVDV